MEENKIKSYKGFDKNLQCRGFQYQVGEEYSTDEGDIKCCERGFHACESPLEVLDYYFFDEKGEMARFCEVEQSGKLDREKGSSTKIASSKIKIKAELRFTDLIRLGIEWLKEKTSAQNVDVKSDSHINDNSGYYAKIGSSGDSAKIGSSGYYAKIGSSGDSAQIGSSGDSAKINSTGKDSVICCAGIDAIVKAKKGSWITLAEWCYDEEKERFIPECVKTEFVDGEKIKEDTWYKLENGNFVEIR